MHDRPCTDQFIDLAPADGTPEAALRNEQEGLAAKETASPDLAWPPLNPRPSTSTTSYLEFYGFAIYLTSFMSFFGCIFWAYVPDKYLKAIGITYYPGKYP